MPKSSWIFFRKRTNKMNSMSPISLREQIRIIDFPNHYPGNINGILKILHEGKTLRHSFGTKSWRTLMVVQNIESHPH